jgi:DeoR/GlpR family transcriptional regulator of sugar metabolism
MSFEDQTARIERLIGLISSSNTGTAVELAKKMGVSRRTVFNDLEFLKGKGYVIDYCHIDNSYFFLKKRKNYDLF